MPRPENDVHVRIQLPSYHEFRQEKVNKVYSALDNPVVIDAIMGNKKFNVVVSNKEGKSINLRDMSKIIIHLEDGIDAG